MMALKSAACLENENQNNHRSLLTISKTQGSFAQTEQTAFHIIFYILTVVVLLVALWELSLTHYGG